jgi:hypothetical protein
VIPLDKLEPPQPNVVIVVSQRYPIEALLSDGTPVWVTYVGERTAVYERPGRHIELEGRELARQCDVLVRDPERVKWSRQPFTRAGHPSRQKARRCADCKQMAGQSPFGSPTADYCLKCEAKRAKA